MWCLTSAFGVGDMIHALTAKPPRGDSASYHHGGRSYYQWMARGTTLVRDVLPLLDPATICDFDAHASERLELMLDRYAGFIGRERARLRESSMTPTSDAES